MISVRVLAVCLFTLLSTYVAGADKPAYQKGVVTISIAPGNKSYRLKSGSKTYQINNCGEFQDGQEVEFTLKNDKIYIAHPGQKDSKCTIETTTEPSEAEALPAPSYMKGTILGYALRRDTHVSGGGGSPGGMVFPIGSSTRKAKVYELQGPDLVYLVDYCGAFQAGQFAPGQEVEFRVDSGPGRLYIRHDGNKEYGCQLEGTRKPDVQPAVAAASASIARLAVTSVPDGSDIEIDGKFVGNTPSDVEVTEGEHLIVVKKSGYKTWERKMNVAARSNIHLNAEMEKSPTS